KLVKGNDTDEYGNYNELDDADDAGGGSGVKKAAGTYYTGLCGKMCNSCPCASCSKRYVTSILCSLGFMISFGIRCNTGVATGYFRSLYNDSELDSHPVSMGPYQDHFLKYKFANVTRNVESDLQWSPSVVGAVESSFFWGYLVTQIPGGIIANKLPATKIFGLAIFTSSFLNLFLPTACHVSFVLVIFIRVLQGLVEGCTYPACHGIWRYWAPPLERSRLATLAFCGSYAGAVLGLFLSGLLSDWLGWPAPFYFYGVVGILWFSVWWFNTYERPALHPGITEEERLYIESSIGENTNSNVISKSMNIPWRSFFTSMPVYAIVVANFARSWSFYLLITEQTKYFRDVFNYDMTKSGTFSALPHLVMAVIVPLGGQLADRLRKKLLTTTVVRKIFNCGGEPANFYWFKCNAQLHSNM
uniref:MFS domain-containing protein n=1 Tax=Macrostomum lignano TaxID=282301 RepID=A0A1I8HJL0_9PLAT